MGLESFECRDARELFECARDAARDAESKLRILKAMEAAEGPRGSGGSTGGGGASDPMVRVDERIVREQGWAKRIEEDYELVDAACAVLYGRDFRGGLDKLLGTAYADVLYFRYLAYESWDTVAERVGYSVKQCQRYCWVAFDFIDANGIEETADGEYTL